MTSIVTKDLLESSELDQQAKSELLGGAHREESGRYFKPDKDILYPGSMYTRELYGHFAGISDSQGQTTSGYGAANAANLGALFGGQEGGFAGGDNEN